jgi:hypothetical protein
MDEVATALSQISNDAVVAPEDRRRCVFALFRSHTRAGMPLSELAATLGGATWLLPERISVVKSLGGKIPVTWTNEDTIFLIRPWLPPGNLSAVYLRVAGKGLEPRALFAVLRGLSKDKRLGAERVLEVGLSESP